MQNKTCKAIIFIGGNLKMKIYKLERFALKQYNNDEHSQLIYFNDLEKAETFYQELFSEPSSDILKRLTNDQSFEIQSIKPARYRAIPKNTKSDSGDILDMINQIEASKVQVQPNRQKLAKLEKLDQLYQKQIEHYPKQIDNIEVSPDRSYTIYFDGASRNNPGQAGVGIALFDNLKLIKEISQPIGVQTNNVAEFTALLFGIKYAAGMGINSIRCFGDSKLVIDGMNNKIDIKNHDLVQLKTAIKSYALLIKDVRYSFIFREQNSVADKLSKKATGPKKIND